MQNSTNLALSVCVFACFVKIMSDLFNPSSQHLKFLLELVT